MAPYNTQYGNYYDPVGSQSNQQPTSYTYQQQSTSSSASYPSATATNYQSAGYNYGDSYGHQPQQQQYSQPTQSSNTNRAAAAALSSLGTSSAPTPTTTYGTSSWGNASANYPGYSTNNRAQQNNSPLYTNQQGNTSNYGRLNVPEQPSTAASNTYTSQACQSLRGTGSSTVQPPPRYASPLHASQAQQNSRASHQPSPQLAAQNLHQHQHQRQQSGSVEPSATTVNPSQVYDDRAERQRQARIEAEKRRKREEQEDARKAEEEARKAEEDRKAAERKAEEDRQKAEADAAKKKADVERKAEQRRKAREGKKQSKSAASAASTLQQMASSGSMNGATSPPPVNDEEAEMRAMFKKMREFNAKNPAMLAKLWEEERSSHTASQSPQHQAAAAALLPASTPTPTNSLASRPAHDSNSNAASAERSTGYRPFLKPPPPPKAAPPAKAPKTAPKAAPKAPPTPQAAPLPATPSAAHSLWSPHQKGTIADAAIRWLTSLPENSGKSMTRDEVHRMLEGNPSYVGLCEGFERSGFRFDRTLLARELLKRVPDGMKGSAKAAVVSTAAQPSTADVPKKKGRKSKDATRSSNVGTVNYETPSFTPLADAVREVNRMGDVIPPVHLGGPVQPPARSSPFAAPQAPPQAPPQALPSPGASTASGSRAPSQSQPPEIKPEVMEDPPKPRANKEEAARKRTFGDLVDLTAQDDSDDEGPPKKIVSSTGGHNGLHAAPQSGPSHLNNPTVSRDFYRPGQQPPLTFGQASAFVAPSANMLPRLSSSVPSNVPAPAPKPKGPSQEQLQQERVRSKMLVEPIMRDRVARKSRYDYRTIARDVLLATGRHPDMRGLNGHLATMSKLLAERGGSYEGTANKSDLSTIRWDIIDPSTLKVDQSRAESKKPLATASTVPLEDDTADADDEGDINQHGGCHIQRQEVNHGDGTVSLVNVYAPASNAKAGLVKRRRGRPARHSLPAGAAGAVGGERQRPGTPARQAPMNGTPKSAPAPGVIQPLGYSAFRALDENGNVVKKKGRPVGWRKTIHSREAAGLSANKFTQGRPKKIAPQPSTEPEPR
ncbi:hypothetical protein EJ03DRAFT_325536 [Teratosphaeria nubilosa]|uniref:Uncharacterized protein n=1 Tax=Teratosphaeria nubilosa TaxID=161662 RepID=A0A6G1LFY9_9PEZI|nr:hypothetical protein EJ03DRAFT_325536 [Teratosphaeria nubilosa]